MVLSASSVMTVSAPTCWLASITSAKSSNSVVVELDPVVALEAGDGVFAEAGFEREQIVAVAAGHDVVAGAADDDVIAIAAGEGVVVGAAQHGVVQPLPPDHDVVAIAAAALPASS